jgi:group I intron endonuclease
MKGIYKIENIENGKLYIGSASNFLKRKSSHFCYLRRGTHHNIHLQRAFNKSKTSFTFTLIEQTENLLEREQHYIDILQPQYNICQIAGRTEGVVCSEETKEKMRLSHSKRDCSRSIETKKRISEGNSGKERPQELRDRIARALSIPIIQLNREGNFIKEYASTTIASRELNITKGNINSTLKGRRKTAGGFKWKYKTELC